MRIGVDVGGTNTDAVLMDGRTVVAATKSPTTEDVSSGIISAITTVMTESKVGPEAIEVVMIGTTHFTNAFVEGKRLLDVGVLRLSLPSASGIPPMADWPERLKKAVGSHIYEVPGGYQFDGRENAALDEAKIVAAARDMKAKGLKTVAICGIFSPINSAQEERAGDIVAREIPGVYISLSSRIGRISLIERENAAIMNASLAELSIKVVESFRDALRKLHITAPFYISQNDGTLMSADHVEKYPVLTFASGPTNSMRGAAYLSGAKNALVADIGGTTTDIGVLANGFPRESSVTVDIGGVRTNFRMPDIFAIGLGGGSLVETVDGSVSVGPESVGFHLLDKARVFGGDVLTASDIAVASGQVVMGDPAHLASLDKALVANALDAIHAKLAEAIDRMKSSASAVPLILVGGGSILISRPIPGTSDMIVPEHAAVANAIGAAIAQVGGEVDRVFSYEAMGRDQALTHARDEAISQAVAAGADPATIEIVDVEEFPLQYMPGAAVRLRVRAVGDLMLGSDKKKGAQP
ncbi:hydantoinase/oxoprolinase family protein [Govanella unica]|uniref:Hydantoinase/oxoprolinase family protein n=1 Tax=Govanella unica TaxID=2975056 RepID=A0A9X3TXY4_9PROT|nr:hydantoinase/oxoprolinase family protein [Govania unica]MDA5194015.1 hydantoinase/oxoprolinase family protein [Govania unica]